MLSSRIFNMIFRVLRINQENYKKIQKILQHKFTKISYVSLTFLFIASIVVLGNQHVENQVTPVYRVFVENQEIGIVSNKELIENYKESRKKELDSRYPYARMILRTDLIELIPDQIYYDEIQDNEVIAILDKLIVPKSVGVDIIVDNQVVATVRDQQTANEIFEKLKEPFTSRTILDPKVKALSDEVYYELNEELQVLEAIEFVENVSTEEVIINPEDVESPEDVLKKLQTGNVEPAKYTVVKGDCLSCIAGKFGLTTEFLYLNNPWLKSDKLQIGDVLDITVLKPDITIKTKSRLEKDEEIRFLTEYIPNGSLRNGLVKTISPGKNGLKKVMYEITKINGIVIEETVISEEILQEPVEAKAYRGTKIILGQGSGKFIWPVISPRITSAYGMRWGTLHKGIDITGNKDIRVADNGKVIKAGYDSGYGNHIIVDHLNGYKTLYAHLSKIGVSVGTIIEKGETIGIMGTTGHSTGVHLHFEIIEEGISLNPLKFLNK